MLLAGCFEADSDPLIPYAHLDTTLIDESSGLCASSNHPHIYWTHNDSGDTPRIFAIDKENPARSRTIRIKGADHVDWEAIASLDAKHLIIGDFGNNYSLREDLKLYVIPEPDPDTREEVSVERVIPFRYEDQTSLLGKRNFDCEAMFVREGRIYLLSKHRSDTATTLYRLEGNLARVVDTFDVGGKVTDAAYDKATGYVAVLTYEKVWVFRPKKGDESIFTGDAYSLPIDLKQCESIVFEGKNLIIGNEQGELFSLPLSRIIP